MLTADHIGFRYDDQGDFAFRDVSLTIRPYEAHLIRGDNGQGKTTLGFALVGAIPHLIGGEFEGDVRWRGTPVNPLSGAVPMRIVLQGSSHPTSRVSIAEELAVRGLRNSTLSPRVAMLLQCFDPRALLVELSLGQRARVAAALALASNAAFVVFDEPFEFLDSSAMASVAAAISEFVGGGGAVTLIDRVHREVSISYAASYQLVDGQLATADTAKRVVEWPELLTSKGSTVLRVSGLVVGYRRRRLLNARFDVAEGESVGVVAPNGAGKSALLLTLAGILPPLGGEVAVDGHPLRDHALRQACRLAMQNPDVQIFETTVERELEHGGWVADAVARDAAELLLRGISEGRDRDPQTLSFGQRKLLTIATTVLLPHRVLLLDEPTAGLDMPARKILRHAVEMLVGNGAAIIVASHDREEISFLCNRMETIIDNVLE